jgi:type II secretory pathway pseudopilin PulG
MTRNRKSPAPCTPVPLADRPSAVRPPAEGGFTLIELLVVVGVMILLIGLLFPAIRAVRNMSYKTDARQTIAQLQAALVNYQQEDQRKSFPIGGPSTAPYLTRDRSFIRHPNPNDPSINATPTCIVDMLVVCGYQIHSEQFETTPGTTIDTMIDGWGRPYRYVNDDATQATAPKPAPLANWNPSGKRPWGYVWSLGIPQGSDSTDADPANASNWIYDAR